MLKYFPNGSTNWLYYKKNPPVSKSFVISVFRAGRNGLLILWMGVVLGCISEVKSKFLFWHLFTFIISCRYKLKSACFIVIIKKNHVSFTFARMDRTFLASHLWHLHISSFHFLNVNLVITFPTDFNTGDFLVSDFLLFISSPRQTTSLAPM